MDSNDPLVKKRPRINPYYYAGEMLFRRILWDLNPQSWISRWELAKWKGRYLGDKAIVLCNGPALNKVDFELIENANCFTFGLNKINILFKRTAFRPNCIVAANPFVIEQNKDFYNQTKIPLFIDSAALRRNWINPRRNVVFFHSEGSPNGFAKDCSMNVYQGYTVTYVALQLAFHMGFEKVALVGADHTFATKGPANKIVHGSDKDESHFDPGYFSNVKWQLPDLFESEVAYSRANNMYNSHDRKIVNCTVGGKLEVFDRESLSDFLM